MTGRGAAQELALGDSDQEVVHLRSLLDPNFLAAAGWDAQAQVLAPLPDHPQLGYRLCRVVGCMTGATRAIGLCSSCACRWYRAGRPDLTAFSADGRIRERLLRDPQECAVLGCPRPAQTHKSKLCSVHVAQSRHRGLSLEAFLAWGGAEPLPSLGGCGVAACLRQAATLRGLCWAHDQRWRRLELQGGDFEAFCGTNPPVADGITVVLRELVPLAQVQVLYGIQERCRQDLKTKLDTLRRLCHRLRTGRIRTLFDLDLPRLERSQRWFVMTAQTAIVRAFSSPETEQRKDVWDMAVFGHRGTIDFTGISQPWLRAAVKRWVVEELPTRRGRDAANVMRNCVNSVKELSVSLRVQRADHGVISTALGRGDIVAFLHRLKHLESTGRVSAHRHHRIASHTAMVLRDCRALGLTQLGAPMAGLPDSFALREGDVPDRPRNEEPGRALPPVILRQLTAALPRVEERSAREFRVAIQLLMDTGRRPNEICALPWDCLEQDSDGKHALIYTDFKNNVVGRRLAIADATANLIREQQQAVRARFSTTPVGDLVLLPRPNRNPRGARPIYDDTLTSTHRHWVATLPKLLLDDDKRTEFDKAKVIPYAYRHSYAQRHADAGTPVDVLCDLMGHDSMTTTQIYYRVTAKRTRAAVDKLAALQFDGRGNRIWREARVLLEHEHQRRAVGQVAVPFGICTEPSNVKAGGHACPFRFRCNGCGHFRSDPSYLPELRSYLDTLLRNRERVRAATELEEWARAEATPSDEEISRLRQLIRRIETDLEQLGDEERQQIDEACRIVRATRQTVHLGMPTIRPPDLDPNLQPNLEPNLEDLA